jgi:hypothetical protein
MLQWSDEFDEGLLYFGWPLDMKIGLARLDQVKEPVLIEFKYLLFNSI